MKFEFIPRSSRAIVTALFFVLFSLPALAQPSFIAPELTGPTLIDHLQANFSVTSPMGYTPARDFMYGSLDNVDGTVSCVYTGFTATMSTRADANNVGINTEHTWPQGLFDSDEPMRGDIHHLFPTRVDVNGARGNYPFAEIPDAQTDRWYYNTSNQSAIPTSNIDLYSELDNNTSFEVREDHKGNTARAIFYFWAIYQDRADVADDASFFNGMKETLLLWHNMDPVDDAEIARSLGIESRQGNRNPFVHDTTLVRRAFYGAGPVNVGPVPYPVTGELSDIGQGFFRLEHVRTDKDTLIGFRFSETTVVTDTLGNPLDLYDYQTVPSASVFWSLQQEDERFADSVAIQVLPGTVNTEDESAIPKSVVLQPNYPNPFNPSTVISFRLDEPVLVQLQVFDATGRQVAELINGHRSSGEHSVRFDAGAMPSGLYYYQLRAGTITLTRSMILMK